MQIDIGFGDSVFPLPLEIKMPTIFDQTPPVLVGYRMETSIAKKLHAMVELGELNCRMKDFYDIWGLCAAPRLRWEITRGCDLETI